MTSFVACFLLFGAGLSIGVFIYVIFSLLWEWHGYNKRIKRLR